MHANRSLSHANRVSGRGLHPAPGNGFRTRETEGPKPPIWAVFIRRRDRTPGISTAETPRKLRAIGQRPRNAGSQWTAWWSERDSNHESGRPYPFENSK